MDIAGVHPLAGFDKKLHYRVPAKLGKLVRPGCLVRIPVGKRFAIGVVSDVGGEPDVAPERLKPLAGMVYDFPAFTPDLVELARWMRTYYGASLESLFEAMLPGPVRHGASFRQEKYLVAKEGISDADIAPLIRRAPTQARLIEFLRHQPLPQKKGLVLSRLKVSPAACAALVEKGFVREEARRVERMAYADEWSEAETVHGLAPRLTDEQQTAVASGLSSLEAGRFDVHLLHGVTGSGKTEVYLALLQRVLESGGGAIILVPEVALAPQTVGRLRGRLAALGAVKPVVWHSHLSDGERFDAWMSLATGQARLVVGARSAIFAPVRDLRLIVVDEEHEPAYKQDESPRYHGRDIAVYRAKLNRALCVLGSATPSLESVANARSKKYRWDRLTRRIDDRKMPDIQIVDMRTEVLRARGPATLSRPLADRMFGRFERREQTILFINRRGYSSAMICSECGYVAECDQCSVARTYHRVDEKIRCHLCGDEAPAPVRCPSCRSPKIRWRGLGTQRVEEAVRRILPGARVVRMDTDAMVRKNRYREILGDFRAGKIDVLVGTQMIAKGLDFPNVTLVGLVDADLSLHVPDFRASERTFQLIVQVAGRAGRGDRAGEVVVQTFTPQADAIQFARRGDFDGFIDAELELRSRFRYPPARHLIHQLFRGPNEDKVAFFAEHWARRAQKGLGDLAEIRGPSPAPIERIRGRYRSQVWYFTRKVTAVVAGLEKLRKEFPLPEDVVTVVNVDPVNLC